MYVKRHARNNMTRNIRLAAKAETSKALIRSARLDSFTQACLTYLRLASEPETQKIMFREAPVVLGQKLRDLDAEGSLGPLQEALEGLIDDGLVVALDAVALARLLNGAMIEGALLIAESENGDEVLAQVSHALESVIFGLKAGSA